MDTDVVFIPNKPGKIFNISSDDSDIHAILQRIADGKDWSISFYIIILFIINTLLIIIVDIKINVPKQILMLFFKCKFVKMNWI